MQVSWSTLRVLNRINKLQVEVGGAYQVQLGSLTYSCGVCYHIMMTEPSQNTGRPRMAALRKRLGLPEAGTLLECKEYRAWASMKRRCYNHNVEKYEHYGGRGITVCDRWKDSFVNFLDDMGRCPEGLSLDRINNDGHYEPGNCKWSTQFEQIHNRRSPSKGVKVS